MALSDVLKHIDEEIARLQQARELLAGSSSEGESKPAAGRPKTSRKDSSTQDKDKDQGKRKRNLSPEGRKAIADAMKKRWAARRGAEETA